MKGKIILISALATLMLLSIVVPTFALTQPEMGTFELGVIEFTINPGEQLLTGNILHIRNGVSEAGLAGIPWGDPITANETVLTTQIDITTGIGSATSHTVDVYPTGTVIGTVQTKINGVGFWTYPGPTFSFTSNGMTATVIHGETYFGLIITTIAVKHGISGDLIGLVDREDGTAVIPLTGPFALAMNFGYATGVYSLS